MNACNGVISELYMAKQRISELEHMTVVTSTNEMQREKGMKDAVAYPRTVG